MKVTLHEGDLPDGLDLGSCVAMDTESMGLKPKRDRLCLVQLSSGDGTAHLVRFKPGPQPYDAPNLRRLLKDPNVTKMFHFARADLNAMRQSLGVLAAPIYCTKIASVLARTFTDRHGLRDLCRDLLGIDISKEQQTSDWGNPNLSQAQLTYAAGDVMHLHALKQKLDDILTREGRLPLAQACFTFLPVRVELDLNGWEDSDIFAYRPTPRRD
ncbi:MAG: ribonuclease D [Alphaproteobacteria bacterium]|nr:MAG: ribonuclease D [Alphaproteobacteria bacterium]